ncbi:hypothetical protein VMCG_09902 [Cytospora schulzeri]|uniref:Beta-lactamase-related domain-containing protein n=1 Tax=Cytospora schulzeri TaxID=448051 RepID=A0A423VDZ2_9PEZI|nr:hypothetical protein VMCG_09902 [Valsa malicola]
MAAKFEATLKELVDTRQIPNVILYASNATGDFQYHNIFGSSSPEANAPALTENVYLFTASCTKLLTSIAVMKLVEEGRLYLDDTVDALLPELAKLEMITKAEFIMEYQTPKNKITYRQLLMHTSGLGYDFVHPYLAAWRKEQPSEGETVPQRFNLPLIHEPGTAWLYSCSLDWAGLAVERISGVTLSEFMTKHIFEPLSVSKDGITFFPLKVPGAQLATLAARTEGGSFVAGTNPLQDDSVEYCYGGQGAYLRGGEYMKILRSLLADDEKLLKRDTVAEMLRPQLNAAQKGSMNELIFAVPILKRTMSRGIDQGKLDQSLCGVVDVEGQSGWRGQGTVAWGGSPNLYWFLDRQRDLCGFFGAQLIPSGDPVYEAMNLEFEKAIPRLSLQIKTIAHGPNLRGSRTVAAAVDQTSPTAFNTLSNVYASAIDRATPVTAINTTQPLKIQTQNLTQGQHGLQTQTQTPFASTYPETPLTAQPLSPAVVAQSVQFPSTMTATPPLSSGPVDENDTKPFSFSAADTAASASTTTPTTGTARRRATMPLNVSRSSAIVDLPYVRNRSLHSILRNSPLPPPTARTPISPRRQSVRLAEKAARRVGYESPIERVITTNQYVRSHIDLLVEEASPASSSASPAVATAAEAQGLGQGPDDNNMVLDLTMAYTGDETRDGGTTPGPFEEMRRRMAGLVTRTPTSPNSSGAGAGLSSPAGVRKRKKKDNKRRWVWTIGTQDDDLDDKEPYAAASTTPIEPPPPQPPTVQVVEAGEQQSSPMEVLTPSIESEYDEESSSSVDERGRTVSLTPGDFDVDMITPTLTRKNHYLEPMAPSGAVGRQDSEGLFNAETGTRRDTPIPADLVPAE